MNSAVNVVLCSSSVTLQAGVLHPKVWLQLGHVPRSLAFREQAATDLAERRFNHCKTP